MPLIDGIEATRLIRAHEKEMINPLTLTAHAESEITTPPNTDYPNMINNKRIPIVAVSASLSEQRIDEYINAGFDAWIMKPIDFRRLSLILKAINGVEERKNILYGIDSWERGGWFNTENPI